MTMTHCVLLVLATLATGLSQTRLEDSATANLPLQRIGANDLVSISVYGSPEFTRTVRIGPEGDLRLPMLKNRIHAAGLLPNDLEEAIGRELSDEALVVDPFVTVSIVEYHSRPIIVTGAVKKPLTFQAIGSVTLIDAITRAEGLTPDAGAEVLVMKPTASGATGIQRIQLRALLESADPKLNLRLEGGEEVRVPEGGRVFVVGNVKKPGAFPLGDGSGTTVLKMLAMAEGLTPFATKQAFVYRRPVGASQPEELIVELKNILNRKAPDLALEANDILYIPDNSGRRLTANAIDKIVGFGGSTLSGVLIWGVH